MKYTFPFLLCLVLALACGCSDDSDNVSKPGGSFNDTATFRRTVIVYLAAENSLGLIDAASDSAEIVNGAVHMNQYDNIVLYIDDKRNPRIYRVCKPTSGKSISLVRQYDNNYNSSDPATLQEVLTWTRTNYPSASYGLVMWSHGDSWLPSLNTNYQSKNNRSFGVDNDGNGYSNYDRSGNPGAGMEIKDMASAIDASGVKLDYILFDACLMQSIEVNYELRHSAKYIIAAPCLVSSNGAYYTSLIKDGLFSYPATDENVAKIAKTYHYSVATIPSYYDMGITISVVKTSELEQLAATTKRVISEAISDRASHDLSSVQPYLYYYFGLLSRPESYDIVSAMKALLPQTTFSEWKKALDKAVIFKATTDYIYVFSLSGAPSQNLIEQCPLYALSQSSGNVTEYFLRVNKDEYCGVSMFVPQQRYTTNAYNCRFGDLNQAFRSTAWYDAAGWDQTGW